MFHRRSPFGTRVFLACLLVSLLSPAFDAYARGSKGGSSSGGSVSVRGYTRRDGTYVQPHVRSATDGNPYNNYSFPGNYNPYTGKTAPGNPDTYLERYYNRTPSQFGSSTPKTYIPSLNGTQSDADRKTSQSAVRCVDANGNVHYGSQLPPGVICKSQSAVPMSSAP